MSKLSGVLALVFLASCASQVTRTEEAIDVSGEWNDVDADLVAKEMIDSCLTSAWIQDWRNKNDQRRPVVRLYPIKNKTAGYIDYRYFTKQIEKAFVNSGLVDVVSSREEAEDVRDERDDQAVHASDDTAKSHGNEIASDFILNGWILTQDDTGDGRAIRAYLTSMEMIEVSTQRKAWIGEKKIKKLLQK